MSEYTVKEIGYIPVARNVKVLAESEEEAIKKVQLEDYKETEDWTPTGYPAVGTISKILYPNIEVNDWQVADGEKR